MFPLGVLRKEQVGGGGGTCGAPANFSATATTATTASASWSAVNGASSYRISWKTASSGTWGTEVTVGGTAYNITGLTPNTSYNARGRTNCNGTFSAYSTTTFSTPASGYVLDSAKVKLLLHFDGNYNDSSPNNHTMTSGGNVSISTSEPKFGTGKLQFGDTPTRDGFVKSPNIFDFGNKRPFTISFFYRGGDGNGCFFTTSDSSIYTPMVFGRGGNFLVGNAALNDWTFVAVDMNISSTAYKHCAVVGDGTNIKVYRDGSLIATTPHPNWASASWLIQLGKEVGPIPSNGGMDEFLLYDGVLWTSDFTPPTAPFTY